jgi:hypothetical protein
VTLDYLHYFPIRPHQMAERCLTVYTVLSGHHEKRQAHPQWAWLSQFLSVTDGPCLAAQISLSMALNSNSVGNIDSLKEKPTEERC